MATGSRHQRTIAGLDFTAIIDVIGKCGHLLTPRLHAALEPDVTRLATALTAAGIGMATLDAPSARPSPSDVLAAEHHGVGNAGGRPPASTWRLSASDHGRHAGP